MKNNKSVIRSNRNSDEKVSYRLVARKELWEEVREAAYNADMSIAFFLKQAIKRNLAAYQKLEG